MAKLNWLVEEDIDLRIDKYLAKHFIEFYSE